MGVTMIVGIGTDLIEIDRVVKVCEKEAFQIKYFTPQEISLCKTEPKKFADNFAVKEAVSKVFGTGFGKIAPIEIEVLRDPLGKPYVNLYGNAKEMACSMNMSRVWVSITNTNKYVSAFAVGESTS
nr:holo-ACP synthase [Anaerocolumna aminovalerica]